MGKFFCSRWADFSPKMLSDVNFTYLLSRPILRPSIYEDSTCM